MILSKTRKFFFFFILFAGIFACLAMILPKSQRPPKVKIDNFPIPKQLIARDTTYFAMYRNRGVQVKIILPEKQLKGMILLLPGWNLPDLDWSTKTSVCSKALSMNFGLVFVEMGKSVYMDSFYPSMRKDYKFYPTRTWLWDTVIKPLQQYGWFTPGSPSFVLGLSTGARGALILGIENSCCIKAVAGLSGDYNPLLDTKDGLMVNTLGAYEKNAFRWRGTNNISLRSEELNCHVFLAHGENDQIVPIAQSLDLWNRIPKQGVTLKKLNYGKIKNAISYKSTTYISENKTYQLRFVSIKDANHDYQFWNKSGLLALDFFKSLLK